LLNFNTAGNVKGAYPRKTAHIAGRFKDIQKSVRRT